MPHTKERKRLLSLAEAAEYANVHPRTIRRYIASGLLKGYRVGPRLLKVDADDLARLARPIPTHSRAAAG